MRQYLTLLLVPVLLLVGVFAYHVMRKGAMVPAPAVVEEAQPAPPLYQPPAPGLHIAVEFLIFPQLIRAGMELIFPFHSVPASNSFPSATSRLRRPYSASSASRPASVMA